MPVDESQQPVFGSPRRLFRAPVTAGPDFARDNYAAAADGGRFLVDGAVVDVSEAAITVLVNWPAEAGLAMQTDTRHLE